MTKNKIILLPIVSVEPGQYIV